MRRMKFFRGVVVAALAGVASLPACSSEDTIVALTVNSTDEVGTVEALKITITQAGQSPVVKTIDPPARRVDAAAGAGGATIEVIQSSFYDRVTLPESWEEEDATIQVDVTNAAGKSFTASTTVRIVEEGAVAARVQLGSPPPTGGGEGGSGGGGGTGGTGGTGGDAQGGMGGIAGMGGMSEGGAGGVLGDGG